MIYKKYLDNWKLAYAANSYVISNAFSPRKISEIENSDVSKISASVPGNFELDLMKNGLLDDLYIGSNILKSQALEGMHVWYYTKIQLEGSQNKTLCFDGIDTVAEVFLDGVSVLRTENMFLEYEVPLKHIPDGKHDLVVHITPACIAERKFKLPSMCRSLKYQRGGLSLRKAAYMYGWDIMPRIVSAGLWRDVYIKETPETYIDDVFIYTSSIYERNAELRAYVSVKSNRNLMSDLTIKIEGCCGDSTFLAERRMFSSSEILVCKVNGAELWWPKNYGEPKLYDVSVAVLENGKEIDRKNVKIGIRTVRLDRTSTAGKDGRFDFYINGKKIFVMGTNIVPTDAFPSRCGQFNERQLELVNDLGCNMVRIWGGGIYPDRSLYDYCDEHGILVWQDFAMACAIYPDSDRMKKLIAEEAESIVCRYRNHPSLAVWSGDNECDEVYLLNRISTDKTTDMRSDPNKNVLTRKIIRHIVETFDGTRPYLPSSPYRDPDAVITGKPAEDHLWGPRDFFKGNYYKNSVAHFASETGYHGCPSPESLRRFITPEHICAIKTGTAGSDAEWLLHAANAEADVSAPYAYRIPLMIRQVERIFGGENKDLAEFALKSQISQAEAVKYFIEKFRTEKGYRSGLLWWNVIDGWPQISDAVVDWYGVKKLAYHYIKRSQQPFCIMAAEPENGNSAIVASNCSMNDVSVSYSVEEMLTKKTVASGNINVLADHNQIIGAIPDEKGFYKIAWEGDFCGFNTYVARISDGLDFGEYKTFMASLNISGELSGF